MAKDKGTEPPKDETQPNTPDTGAPLAEAKEEQPRLRQSNAPICPYCSKAADKKAGTKAVVVVCKSVRSDPFFTRYQCPTPDCPFSAKVAKPQLADRLRKEQEEEGFSARPGK